MAGRDLIDLSFILLFLVVDQGIEILGVVSGWINKEIIKKYKIHPDNSSKHELLFPASPSLMNEFGCGWHKEREEEKYPLKPSVYYLSSRS